MPSSHRWQAVCGRIADACARAGIDLVQPLQLGWYNARVASEYRIPDFGRADALAVVIANTRALWPRLIDALSRDPALAAHPDPVDHYCERHIAGAVADAVRDTGDARATAWDIRYAPEPPPRRVAIQTAAHVSGLAALSAARMCVHPVYGPWIALRAVAAFDLPGPPGPPPAVSPPCACEHHCAPALDRAIAASAAPCGGFRPLDQTWRDWLAVRDACPVGRAHRYGPNQLHYHYLKRREFFKID